MRLQGISKESRSIGSLCSVVLLKRVKWHHLLPSVALVDWWLEYSLGQSLAPSAPQRSLQTDPPLHFSQSDIIWWEKRLPRHNQSAAKLEGRGQSSQTKYSGNTQQALTGSLRCSTGFSAFLLGSKIENIEVAVGFPHKQIQDKKDMHVSDACSSLSTQ